MLEAIDKELKIDHLKPRMKTLNSFNDLEPSSSLVIMAKADGEFTKLEYRRTSGLSSVVGTFSYARTINRYGRWRTDFPALNEVVEALDRTDLKEVEMLVELFAVDDQGRPLILPDFIHAAKGKDLELRKRIHIGVWDLVSVNGKPVRQDYKWKLEELKSWLRTESGCRLERAYVLPHHVKPSRKDIRDFWDLWVRIAGYEGVVARDGSDIYKIKPIRDVDAVIIALNKVDSSGKLTKRWVEKKVSTVRVALMDKDGRFVELGDCTIANPNAQSALWNLHEYKVSEGSQRVYVKPLVVIQIQYTSAFEGSLCRNWQFNWTSGGYVACGSRKFYKLRHPRFLRFRRDKQVCPEDLRLEQIKDGE